jgi:hypothetical protein
LENYCHNKQPNPRNGLLTGCMLYPTKAEHMTPSLQIAIDTAEYFRELKELWLLPSLDDMTAFEFECYKAAERASRKVQNDKIREMEEKDKKPSKLGQGDQSAIDW